MLGSSTLKFRIQGHVVLAECNTGGDADDTNRITLLQIWAFHLIRGYLDAISFVNGVGLTIILNQFSGPDRIYKQLISIFPDLAAVCTVQTQELFLLTLQEQSALKHLHDLADSLNDPMEAFFLCGRAVEGFRSLLLQDKTVSKQWEFMRENLNLSVGYLKLITDMSISARHGGTGPINPAEIHEVRKRAWTIANRFLEFRKRKSARLSEAIFPVL
jgi:hypothetical protein